MTDDEIQALIACPKRIIRAEPHREYEFADRSRKKNLTLQGEQDPSKNFYVFIRQNETYIENFSVGLRYKTGDKNLGVLTLIRYNGGHGASIKDESRDGHYSKPHIHRLTAELISRGLKEPREIQITDRYSTFDEALWAFAEDCGIVNWQDYFTAQLQLIMDKRESK